MDMFVYFFERIKYGLDEIEDAIEEALGDYGEVTGTGTGPSGSNIDIEFFEESLEKSKALEIVKNTLKKFDLPSSTIIKLNAKTYQI